MSSQHRCNSESRVLNLLGEGRPQSAENVTDKQQITLPCPQHSFVHHIASHDVRGSNLLCVWYILLFVKTTYGAPESADPEAMQLQSLAGIERILKQEKMLLF